MIHEEPLEGYRAITTPEPLQHAPSSKQLQLSNPREKHASKPSVQPQDASRISLISRDFFPSIEDLVVVRLEVRDNLRRRLFHGFRPLLLRCRSRYLVGNVLVPKQQQYWGTRATG